MDQNEEPREISQYQKAALAGNVELMIQHEGSREGAIFFGGPSDEGFLEVTPVDDFVFEITQGPGPYFPPGDLTMDWAINGLDIQPFMACVLGVASGPAGDFTGDGKTLIDDVPYFVEALLQEPQD